MRAIRQAELDAFRVALRRYGNKFEVIFEVGLATGLRIGDILRLRYSDFLPDRYWVQVIEQKTGKARRVTVPDSLRYFLGQKLVYYGYDLESLLAPGRREGQAVSRNRVYRVFKAVGRELGMNDIGTHSMRKTFARTLYISSGGDLEKVQNELNHKYPATTICNYLLDGDALRIDG